MAGRFPFKITHGKMKGYTLEHGCQFIRIISLHPRLSTSRVGSDFTYSVLAPCYRGRTMKILWA